MLLLVVSRDVPVKNPWTFYVLQGYPFETCKEPPSELELAKRCHSLGTMQKTISKEIIIHNAGPVFAMFELILGALLEGRNTSEEEKRHDLATRASARALEDLGLAVVKQTSLNDQTAC